MHVISRKALRLFWEKYPDSQTALALWFKVVTTTDFLNFAELRAAFPSVDKVDKWVVFNLGGNKPADRFDPLQPRQGKHSSCVDPFGI